MPAADSKTGTRKKASSSPRSRSRATPENIRTTEFERRGMQLRMTGATFAQIAAAVKDENGKQVWGTEGPACRAITRALRETRVENAEELKLFEQQRLDALIGAFWDGAMRGEVRSGELILQTLRRRAELLGLDEPQRLKLTVVDEGALEELAAQYEQALAALAEPSMN